jgi:phosphatidylglycerophosphate synthase
VIRQAVLYLSTPDDVGAALLPVAGRPVAFRAVMAAVRAGIGRVAVPAALRRDGLARAVAGTPSAAAAVEWVSDPTRLAAEPTLLLPAATLVPVAALQRLRGAAVPGVAGGEDDRGAPVVAADAGLLGTLADDLAAAAPVGDRLRHLAGRLERAEPPGWRVHVTTPAAAREAEAALYAGLGSAIDSRLDTLLHRRLSRPLTRLAIRAGVTPNQVSVLSLLVGLAAFGAFWEATPARALAALALYTASVVLDHADGEVARLTFAESRLGAWLDVLVDTVVHALVVLAMGVTAASVTGTGTGLGALAAIGVVASAATAWVWPPSPNARGVSGLLDALSGRDGYYAMLVAFILGLAIAPATLPALMVLVALGANAYWMLRVVASLAR